MPLFDSNTVEHWSLLSPERIADHEVINPKVIGAAAAMEYVVFVARECPRCSTAIDNSRKIAGDRGAETHQQAQRQERSTE